MSDARGPIAAVELVRAADLTEKAPYAYAAIAAEGSLVFTAGACPLDAAGETIGVGDIAEQAEQVMTNLESALRAAGSDLAHVLKSTVFVATQRQEDLVTAWEVVRRRFGDHDAPSTLVGVAVLGYRDQLVEVEAVATQARRPAVSAPA